jgi:hypothetical protein
MREIVVAIPKRFYRADLSTRWRDLYILMGIMATIIAASENSSADAKQKPIRETLI